MAARQWAARLIFLMARLGLAANDYGRLLVYGSNTLRVFFALKGVLATVLLIRIRDPESDAF
jgi:hypothetical protein